MTTSVYETAPPDRRCCLMTGGVHDANCPTDRPSEEYRCVQCGVPDVGERMRFGRCQHCLD